MFEFAEVRDNSMPHAYQVRRSLFDGILLRNAGRKGASIIGNSGRDNILGNRRQTKQVGIRVGTMP